MPDLLVLGAGKSGVAAARAARKAGADVLLVEKGPDAPSDAPCDVLGSAFAWAPLRSAGGHVCGARVVRGREEILLDARVVVLACGGVAGLWQAEAPLATGDALAIAHRAGAALHRLTELRRTDGRVWIHGGVAA
ncbi:MAG TPA: FAD-binding protein, partial [Candidatus Thermoplasmatota archaeon]|nr:FAD-binding protein [Candidatus Thermoplasmatota archaeon]